MTQTLSREEARKILSKPKANKYRAKTTTIDGIRFASQAEAKRYSELKTLEKANEISALVLQPKFPLYDVTGFCVGHWIADFQYRCHRRGTTIVEDVKSKATRTALYRWKKRHFESQYRMQITEIER